MELDAFGVRRAGSTNVTWDNTVVTNDTGHGNKGPTTATARHGIAKTARGANRGIRYRKSPIMEATLVLLMYCSAAQERMNPLILTLTVNLFGLHV